jgi:glycerophosphoryl diester phosphodiesterase
MLNTLPLLALLWLSAAAHAATPQVAAHRGGASLMPENTIPAFQNAIRLGAGILEFDMNLTADDQLILHHDSTVSPAVCTPLAGSTVQPGPIRRLTLAQLKQFDCGSKRTAARPHQALSPGARMPTLEEFFQAVSRSKVKLLGETKMPPPGAPDTVDPVRFVERIDALIRKYKLEDRFILQSFDYRTIDEMRRRNPRVALCLLGARRFKPDYLALARKHGATHLMLTLGDADAAGFQRLQQAGLKLFSGTSNRDSEWPEYLRLGFDAILTDDPQAALAFLKRNTK